MPKIRVLIVDDSVVMRRLITEALAGDPRIEIAGTAANGRLALRKLTELNPDVVTMDVEMPELDGVSTVRELRRTHPKLPVVMFSTLTQRGAAATLDALAAGASDYVTKPTDVSSLQESITRLREELLPKIHAHVAPPMPAMAQMRVTKVPVRAVPDVFDLLCIGSSTGGPQALEKLFLGFRSAPRMPVAVVQHMPPMFTRMLAERLNALPGPLRCREAEEGMTLEPGVACLAPGGHHLTLERRVGGRFVIKIVDTAPENSCRPSVDVLFRSAALTKASVLGVVLTGMGQDGLRGCEHIREAGGRVLAQDQATSVVWGMPGSVVQAGLADLVLPIADISAEIEKRLAYGRSAGKGK